MNIRKITAGPSPTQGSMAFSIGQKIYDGNIICKIEQDKDSGYTIYIKKNSVIKPWKKYSPQVPVYLEYDLDYSTNK